MSSCKSLAHQDMLKLAEFLARTGTFVGMNHELASAARCRSTYENAREHARTCPTAKAQSIVLPYRKGSDTIAMLDPRGARSYLDVDRLVVSFRSHQAQSAELAKMAANLQAEALAREDDAFAHSQIAMGRLFSQAGRELEHGTVSDATLEAIREALATA